MRPVVAGGGPVLPSVFRNPVAGAGLLGVSSGASLGAVLAVNLGWATQVFLALPLMAFAGALAAIGAVYVLAHAAGRPTLHGLLLTGLAVGMIGAALMALPTIGEGRSSATGVLLILGAVSCYGVALNVAGPLQQRNGALPVIWRAQAVALVLTAPLGIPDLSAAHWSPVPLLSMLALGALGTGVAYVLLTVATGRVGATRASATNFLIAPVSLLLGVTLRGEHVAAPAIVGAAVAVTGAWLMQRARISSSSNPITQEQARLSS